MEIAICPTLESIVVVAKPHIVKSQNDILPSNFSSKFSHKFTDTLIQWPLRSSSIGAHALFRALSGPAGTVNLGCFPYDLFFDAVWDVNGTDIWMLSLI